MFKSITARSMTAIAAAAVVAGLAVFLTSVAPEAKAESLVKDARHQPHAQSNRPPVPVKGAACSQQGWPHHEQSCLFDKRRSAEDVRKVRVVNLDRREMQASAPTIEILALR